jgi:hypothetical protein
MALPLGPKQESLTDEVSTPPPRGEDFPPYWPTSLEGDEKREGVASRGMVVDKPRCYRSLQWSAVCAKNEGGPSWSTVFCLAGSRASSTGGGRRIDGFSNRQRLTRTTHFSVIEPCPASIPVPRLSSSGICESLIDYSLWWLRRIAKDFENMANSISFDNNLSRTDVTRNYVRIEKVVKCKTCESPSPS